MHYLRSTASLHRFRICSVLLILMFMSVPAAIYAFFHAVFLGNVMYFAYCGAFTITGAVLFLIIIVIGSKARCPLCMMPPLLSKSCSKNRKAETLLGSYRLKVAVNILVNGHFRCPYCGEPSMMKVKDRNMF